MLSNQACITHQVPIFYAQLDTLRRSSIPEHSDYSLSLLNELNQRGSLPHPLDFHVIADTNLVQLCYFGSKISCSPILGCKMVLKRVVLPEAFDPSKTTYSPVFIVRLISLRMEIPPYPTETFCKVIQLSIFMFCIILTRTSRKSFFFQGTREMVYYFFTWHILSDSFGLVHINIFR